MRAWRSPLTYQTYERVPIGLAERLDELAAAARPVAGEAHSIERSRTRERARQQVDQLLRAFGYRDAYRRTIDELHAGDDGLLPISEDRRAELRATADTFAGMRDLAVAWAVQEGASIEDAALAAGISIDTALDAVRRETENS